MKIAIGSKNPVKVEAVKDGLAETFPNAEFIGIEVASGVSEQPMGDEETSKGAINRAVNAQKTTCSDFGVGLEGGVKETEYGLMGTVWCAIVNKKGIISLGGGLNFHIPSKAAELIRKGIELGKAMDRITNRKDVKHQEGAIGIVTKGATDRKKSYESLVRLAVAKHVSPELYE